MTPPACATVPAMADRCGSLTTFEPVIQFSGPLMQITMVHLPDGRRFVPDVWLTRYPDIADFIHSNCHYVGKLDGWMLGPTLQ